MTKREFSMIASALRTYYPKENILPNEPAMQLWYDLLQDIPYDVLQIALKQWVVTNKWSPSVSELRQAAIAICEKDNPHDWGEAWQKVLKAISKYGSYQEAEALASFDDLTADCVRNIGWRTLCFSEEISVERANFRKLYEIKTERHKEMVLLPESIRTLIAETKVKMIEGGTKNA